MQDACRFPRHVPAGLQHPPILRPAALFWEARRRGMWWSIVKQSTAEDVRRGTEGASRRLRDRHPMSELGAQLLAVARLSSEHVELALDGLARNGRVRARNRDDLRATRSPSRLLQSPTAPVLLDPAAHPTRNEQITLWLRFTELQVGSRAPGGAPSPRPTKPHPLPRRGLPLRGSTAIPIGRPRRNWPRMRSAVGGASFGCSITTGRIGSARAAGPSVAQAARTVTRSKLQGGSAFAGRLVVSGGSAGRCRERPPPPAGASITACVSTVGVRSARQPRFVLEDSDTDPGRADALRRSRCAVGSRSRGDHRASRLIGRAGRVGGVVTDVVSGHGLDDSAPAPPDPLDQPQRLRRGPFATRLIRRRSRGGARDASGLKPAACATAPQRAAILLFSSARRQPVHPPTSLIVSGRTRPRPHAIAASAPTPRARGERRSNRRLRRGQLEPRRVVDDHRVAVARTRAASFREPMCEAGLRRRRPRRCVGGPLPSSRPAARRRSAPTAANPPGGRSRRSTSRHIGRGQTTQTRPWGLPGPRPLGPRSAAHGSNATPYAGAADFAATGTWRAPLRLVEATPSSPKMWSSSPSSSIRARNSARSRVIFFGAGNICFSPVESPFCDSAQPPVRTTSGASSVGCPHFLGSCRGVPL